MTKKIVLLLDEKGSRETPDSELNTNIYCIDNQFHIIWQIDAEQTKFKQDPFTSIKLDENGKIKTKRFSGFKYEIDIETGKAKITGWEQIKLLKQNVYAEKKRRALNMV